VVSGAACPGSRRGPPPGVTVFANATINKTTSQSWTAPRVQKHAPPRLCANATYRRTLCVMLSRNEAPLLFQKIFKLQVRMKKSYLIAIFLFIVTELSSQLIMFDEFISLQKPDNLVVYDTVIQDLKILKLESDTGSYSFAIIRLDLNPKESEINGLPYDSTSLEQIYQDFIRDFNKTTRESGFEVIDSVKVEFNGFIAYKVIANTTNVDTILYTTLILILDKYGYTFSYWGPYSEGANRMNNFMNSVTINSDSKPSQTIGKSSDYKIGYLVGEVLAIPLLLVFIFFVIKFIRKRKR